MKILHKLPPNYKEIQTHFPWADFDKGVVFTYGDTCYCEKDLPLDLYVHEEVHSKQQTNPEEWWAKYITDPEFRLSQEMEAYQAQWSFIKRKVRDRSLQHRVRTRIARVLSGKLYGGIITFNQAYKALRK